MLNRHITIENNCISFQKKNQYQLFTSTTIIQHTYKEEEGISKSLQISQEGRAVGYEIGRVIFLNLSF